MSKKTVIIIISVIAALAAAAGIGVLIWWLVAGRHDEDPDVSDIGLGSVNFHTGFANIPLEGNMFWWFYPSLSSTPTVRPIIVWLNGITGFSPSLMNFFMLGPYDFNITRREDSWIDQYSLLFIDAPLGVGFSAAERLNQITGDLDRNADHLIAALESFYGEREEYKDAPLYVIGQGHGAQLALSLATKLNEVNSDINLKGVIIGNGVISPAQVMTKLGFYLEEFAYIDNNGRNAIETLSEEINMLVNQSRYGDAYDLYISLSDFIDNDAGAVAVSLGRIVDKVSLETENDEFNIIDMLNFMQETVAPKLGIENVVYDGERVNSLLAFRNTFMIPSTDKVEYLLENTDITVAIYHGNLDAFSNIAGQIEWVNNLQWSGQQNFLTTPRMPIIVNGLLEGHYRETTSQKLQFYWMNAAGQTVQVDSPHGMRRVLDRITGLRP